MSNIIGSIKVCQDCMFSAVNGESEGIPADAPEPWNLITGNEHHLYVMGVESHESDCGHDEYSECNCGHDDFNTWPCEACGTPLAGDRYEFVKFDS